MLNNVNNDLILNNPLDSQSKISGVDKKSSAKNPYADKVIEFDDTLEISEQAIKLLEREKDIEKFKNMVMETIDAPYSADQIDSIVELINSDQYITDDDLASKLLDDEEFLNNSDILKIMFSGIEKIIS